MSLFQTLIFTEITFSWYNRFLGTGNGLDLIEVDLPRVCMWSPLARGLEVHKRCVAKTEMKARLPYLIFPYNFQKEQSQEKKKIGSRGWEGGAKIKEKGRKRRPET